MKKIYSFKNSALYIPDCAERSNTRSAYLVIDGTTDMPDTITAHDSLFTYDGVYLFFRRFPQSDDELNLFLKYALSFLANSANVGTRFVWLEYDGLRGNLLKTYSNDIKVFTSEVTWFDLRNIALRINNSNKVGINGNDITFTPEIPDNVLFITPEGYQPRKKMKIENLVLPVDSDDVNDLSKIGCFQFNITIDEETANTLDIGLRYFMPGIRKKEIDKVKITDSELEGIKDKYGNIDENDLDKLRLEHLKLKNYVTSLRYPIFDLTDNNSILTAFMDPLDQLNHDRTFFAFENEQSIRSFYRTILGRTIFLTPQENAKLVFTEKILTGTSNDNMTHEHARYFPYYIVPSGDFIINIEGRDKKTFSNIDVKHNFVCGLSGVEYIGLEQEPSAGAGAVDEPYIMTFIPGKPAFAPAEYGFEKDAAGNIKRILSTYKKLTDLATTAWSYVKHPSYNLVYYAQPDNSVLHKLGENTNADDYVMLDYLEIPSGNLPPEITNSNNGPVPELLFPLVPYAGVKLEQQTDSTELKHKYLYTDDYKQMEVQVLSPKRRENIYEISRNIPGPDIPKTTDCGVTPGGLKVTFGDNYESWKTVTIAKSYDIIKKENEPEEKKELFLNLHDIQKPLKAALQTNQQFLVISSFDLLKNHCTLKPEDSILKIQDWGFDFYGDNWIDMIDTNTILIFKFFDKSIKELVADTDSWTLPDEFNRDIESIRVEIEKIISEDNPKRKDPSYCYFFEKVIDNEEWNGILALNCGVSFEQMPDEIKGLSAGIKNPADFYAHHLGINITPVNDILDENNEKKLVLKESSMFGMLDYNDLDDLTLTIEDYDFKVKSLKVQFRNSEVTEFSSEIQLLVKKLFGEAVLRKKDGSNLIDLYGIYQKQDGKGSYIFLNKEEVNFISASKVVDRIELDRIQFVTTLPKEGTAESLIKAKFLFWGDLKFHDLAGFDGFSFGAVYSDDGNEEQQGALRFSDMSIDVEFPKDFPFERTFAFNAENVDFDISQSKPRSNSLYAHFPIKFRRIIQAKGNLTTDSLNYMPVDTPLGSSGIKDEWYAIEYDLNMGTPGMLGGNIDFKCSLLLAWSPNENDYSVFVGLKIPGVSGGKREISIQGILKLTFGEVRFTVSHNGAGYLLQIRDIQLKFFTQAFPSQGQTNILMFGDPTGEDRETLGWYAAYDKEPELIDKKKKTKELTKRVSAS